MLDDRFECVWCRTERIGCGCDGALDDGCFHCTPHRHQRPPCAPQCTGYVGAPKPPAIHQGITLTEAEFEHAKLLRDVIDFAYQQGYHEHGVDLLQQVMLASRLAGAKHAYAECRSIATSHQNIGEQFGGLSHPACGSMIVQQIEVAEHMTERRGHTLEFYR